MNEFTSVHQESILGVVSMFDRLIFKGYLMDFFPPGAFKHFLSRQGVLLINFKSYVEKATAKLRAHVEKISKDTGRPLRYLESSSTHASKESKEDIARKIAQDDNITEGLVCVLSVVEPCTTLAVKNAEKRTRAKKGKGAKSAKRVELDAMLQRGKCLHYYFYIIDEEFGWMHIRIQTWFPFSIQVYINGREWLSRKLDNAGISYTRFDNTFLNIDDIEWAQKACDRFIKKRNLVRTLNSFATRLNPLLPTFRRWRIKGYYWVTDQCEYATDIMFKDRKSLEAIYPDLIHHANLHFSAEDVLSFLGRKLHGNFQGDLTTDLKKRLQGYRVKHRVKGNSIKMYDKVSVLRVETTINNPREFKILKVEQTEDGEERRWVPMAKRVANLWRFADISKKANVRYLNALAQVEAKGEAIKELDDLCRGRTVDKKRYAKFNPVANKDASIFKAAMAGENMINGFRNRDLARRLFPGEGATHEGRRRRCARTSRLISKLRGHKLISKVKDSRLYRVTNHGWRVMGAALRFRWIDFPTAYQEA